MTVFAGSRERVEQRRVLALVHRVDALDLSQLAHRLPGLGEDLGVRIAPGPAEALGQSSGRGRLSGRHETGDHHSRRSRAWRQGSLVTLAAMATHAAIEPPATIGILGRLASSGGCSAAPPGRWAIAWSSSIPIPSALPRPSPNA
jgi:hypothetical protein